MAANRVLSWNPENNPFRTRSNAARAEIRVTPQLLMVEDNPGDVYLIRQALREAGFECRMTVAADGDEALGILHRENGEHRLPDMVLLDLNLPKRSGHEVLREIKSDPQLRRIPVIVLSSSQAESDLRTAYDLHANCYIHKPSTLSEVLHVAQQIASFWFSAVSLPRGSTGVVEQRSER
ncbi:MAG: response regulator [Bryobacteraceae bacterium]|nr:response regulator [Bryobacteraceae bacterium]